MNETKRKERRGRPRRYDFGALQIGEHIEAPRDMGVGRRHSDSRQRSMSNSARRFMKLHPGVTLVVRCINEETVRCTRLT